MSDHHLQHHRSSFWGLIGIWLFFREVFSFFRQQIKACIQISVSIFFSIKSRLQMFKQFWAGSKRDAPHYKDCHELPLLITRPRPCPAPPPRGTELFWTIVFVLFLLYFCLSSVCVPPTHPGRIELICQVHGDYSKGSLLNLTSRHFVTAFNVSGFEFLLPSNKYPFELPTINVSVLEKLSIFLFLKLETMTLGVFPNTIKSYFPIH